VLPGELWFGASLTTDGSYIYTAASTLALRACARREVRRKLSQQPTPQKNLVCILHTLCPLERRTVHGILDTSYIAS